MPNPALAQDVPLLFSGHQKEYMGQCGEGLLPGNAQSFRCFIRHSISNFNIEVIYYNGGYSNEDIS